MDDKNCNVSKKFTDLSLLSIDSIIGSAVLLTRLRGTVLEKEAACIIGRKDTKVDEGKENLAYVSVQNEMGLCFSDDLNIKAIMVRIPFLLLYIRDQMEL